MRGFVEQLKSRLLLSSVIGESVRLTRKGKDFWGLCPFHKEKSPSFVVHDDTARYHCFGCGADGDAISFLETLRSLSFREAIAELAPKAGLSLPEDMLSKPAEPDTSQPLYTVLQTANAWFQEQLTYSTATATRDYLAARGVSKQACQIFQLGWAPGHTYHAAHLKQALTEKGVSASLLEKAGLVFPPLDGKPGRDRFRARLIFPIHDDKGRVIGFGGRVQDQTEPKYLNSPETPVFEKKRHLYGLWQALKTPHLASQPVVIVEGYLDVIALQTAGIARALAPLGTAMGDSQLLQAWRLSPTPLICFDGDGAGHQASIKTALHAVPLLKPGFSLNFCTLPDREDPQSLVFKGEGALLQTLFEDAVPLVDYLWTQLENQISLRTPESQAAFRKEYKNWCQTISHSDVRSLYERTFDARFYDAIRARPRPLRQQPKLTASSRALLRTENKQTLQIQILLITLIHHPSLIAEFAPALATLFLPSPEQQAIQEALLTWAEEPKLDLSEETVNVEVYLETKGLIETVYQCLDPQHVLKHAAFAHKNADLQKARCGFQDVFDHYQREAALKPELEEAQTLFARSMHEKSWKRLQRLKEIYIQLR